MAKRKNPKDEGAAASTTTPKTTKPNFNDNSAHNQRLKLLDWLLEKGRITTDQAREHLDIMSPAARIFELKDAGYLIVTFRGGWTSEFGIKHSVAKYVLTQKEPVERDNESEATLMYYYQLYNRACALAIRCNHYAIVHDLPMMTENDLMGVIMFLTQLRAS